MLNNSNRKTKYFATLVLFLVIGQSFAQYEMKRYSINGGGSKMTGGAYEMQSSIGQADASDQLTGGNFKVQGGFWHENNDLIFKNKFD